MITDQESVLSGQDKARLWRALSTMPYGAGLLTYPAARDNVTVDALVKMLEQLATRLDEHAVDCRHRDDELSDLRGVIRGGRELLRLLAGPE